MDGGTQEPEWPVTVDPRFREDDEVGLPTYSVMPAKAGISGGSCLSPASSLS